MNWIPYLKIFFVFIIVHFIVILLYIFYQVRFDMKLNETKEVLKR
jgi:hypothetical protein